MNQYRVLATLIDKIKINMHSGYNVGAVVIDRKGSPISWGYNSYTKTHPKTTYGKYKSDKIFLHAELDALTKIHKDKAAYAMIICRLGKEGQILLSKPCPGCYFEIQNSNLKDVYYTDSLGKLVLLDTSVDIDNYVYDLARD